MNEIKEVVESTAARIKSPFFGYVFFVALFLNWKVWFFLAFSGEPALDRFQYFDDNTTVWSLLIIPIILGFAFAITSPWGRWFFTWAALQPTTKRVLVQAKSEQDVLAGKATMEKARMELQIATEERLISAAKRDLKIGEIEDEDVREKLQRQIDELREAMSENEMTADPSRSQKLPFPEADLQLRLRRRGDTDYEFVLENTSNVSAQNVKFELIPPPGVEVKVERSEFGKFPLDLLGPHEAISIKPPKGIKAISAASFAAIATWDNPAGNTSKKILEPDTKSFLI